MHGMVKRVCLTEFKEGRRHYSGGKGVVAVTMEGWWAGDDYISNQSVDKESGTGQGFLA